MNYGYKGLWEAAIKFAMRERPLPPQYLVATAKGCGLLLVERVAGTRATKELIS